MFLKYSRFLKSDYWNNFVIRLFIVYYNLSLITPANIYCVYGAPNKDVKKILSRRLRVAEEFFPLSLIF